MLSYSGDADASAQVPQGPARAAIRLPRVARVMLLLAGFLAVAAVAAVPAGAKVVTDQLTHKKFGIVLPFHKKAAASPLTATCNADNSDCAALSWGGGPVQHAEKDYLLYWTPSGHSVPSAYRSGMSTWLGELSHADFTAGNPVSTTQQYYDNSGAGGRHNFVPYAVSGGGTIVDTDSYPASGCTDSDPVTFVTYSICLTDAQIETEVQNYVNAHHLPTGLNVQYFVLTPYNVGSCFDSTSGTCAYAYYCGYHSNFTDSSNSAKIVYADMPWIYNTGCDINLDGIPAGYPNADGIDPVVSVFSHELSETMTDPEPGSGWTQTASGSDQGYENGDKCAYIYGSGGYGSLSGLSNNGLGYWNVALFNDEYLMQLEYSNANGTCEKTDTQTQPSSSLSITPNPPVHGSSATFKVVVSDPTGVAYVHWNFGDGHTASSWPYSSTSTTTVSVTHTYATAGQKVLLVATVTDEHGNETKRSATYTVG